MNAIISSNVYIQIYFNHKIKAYAKSLDFQIKSETLHWFWKIE